MSEQEPKPKYPRGTLIGEMSAAWSRYWALNWQWRVLSFLGIVIVMAIVIPAVVRGGNDGGGGTPRTSSDGGGGTTRTSSDGASSESLEYKLAVVHEGGFVAEDDPLVQQFRQVLDSLEPKCTESRQKIADMGVAAHDLLKDKGVSLSLLRVMQDVDYSIPAELSSQPCADIFATYVTLTERP